MCGISGIYALNGQQPVERDELLAQIETIVHRGPDQGGFFLSSQGRCGLGIRRLSIIDVAGGRQPLGNEDGSIHLVYNGETYNHQSLRRELEQSGHRPKSHSDAEVVLHGYEAWGVAPMLQKLRGMGAFALWDDKQQQLVLARDRFGIKPLYYARHADRLYFASEIKAILTQSSLSRRVNLPALNTMLRLGFVPGPETMFAGVYKLPPAHYLIAQGDKFYIKKYWQLDYSENHYRSENEVIEQFLALLRESVRLRLMSEVPLGALLSGGLDSGALVALIEQHTAAADGRRSAVGKLKTVSIGFEDAAYDETPMARSLAQSIGTDHQPFTFTNSDFNDYPQVMYHLEEPQCAATAIPIYRLYRTCRQAGLTVVLTGEGADELLGGYHWHRGDALARRLLCLPVSLRRFIAASPLRMSPAARRVLRRGSTELSTRYQDWLEVEGDDYRSNLLAGDVICELQEERFDEAGGWWSEILEGLQTNDPFQQILWLEAQTRLVDFINFEVDKMSMAHSIEARVPYLDHELWEFCAGLPSHYKLRGRTEKYLLSQAVKYILPHATRRRRKKGLAAPYAAWLQAERLPEWAEIALSPATIRTVGLFNPATVQNLRQAHQAGRPSLGALLMGVLSTQVWFESFMK